MSEITSGKILVTGATGHFGKTAIEVLLQKGVSAGGISALVRDEAKATDLKARGIELKVGEYDDYSSLLEAFQNIEQLLFVSSSEIDRMERQHRNVVQAAQEAGIERIVYTSVLRKNETESSPVAVITKASVLTEELIKASNLRYAIMKNGFYAEALPMFFGDEVLETGIFFPAGEGKAAYAARADMAEAAVNLLLKPDEENKEYFIAGHENHSMRETADILSELTGREISYVSPPIEEYKKSLAEFNMPQEEIEMIAGFAKAIEQDEYSIYESDLETILDRKPQTLREYLKSVYQK